MRGTKRGRDTVFGSILVAYDELLSTCELLVAGQAEPDIQRKVFHLLSGITGMCCPDSAAHVCPWLPYSRLPPARPVGAAPYVHWAVT